MVTLPFARTKRGPIALPDYSAGVGDDKAASAPYGDSFDAMDSEYSQKKSATKKNWTLLLALLLVGGYYHLARAPTHTRGRYGSSPSPSHPSSPSGPSSSGASRSPVAAAQFAAARAACAGARAVPGAPSDFAAKRTQSERFDAHLQRAPGSSSGRTRIVNATLWTGGDAGREVRAGVDVLLEHGIIKRIAKNGELAHDEDDEDTHVFDAQGRWVTPGLVDVHVHMGVGQIPSLPSTEDTNTRKTPVAPYLRSLDGLNQHDLSFKRTVAGGVTSGMVLPGSGGNIGGQAFVIKLRPTKSHSPTERVVEPPTTLAHPRYEDAHPHAADIALLSKEERAAYDAHLASTGFSLSGAYAAGEGEGEARVPWRHMKMACGENARRLYGLTRMDEQWGFRQLFERAAKLRAQQDAFCERADAFVALNGGEGAAPASEADRTFPTELELEALVAVLRGQVKVNTHCYTSTDFDSFVRLSNEFKFPVAAFHHAHESWLVPDVIKRVYRPVVNASAADAEDRLAPPPALAIFSTNANYKFEAYFGTPHAGPILKQAGLVPLYKSDHPVTDSRRILNQAAQAHHFGLDAPSALAGVTSAAADALGMGHRMGYVREGYDADVVVWNTHPLRIGATPVQVWIDGQRQLADDAPVPHPHLPQAAGSSSPSSASPIAPGPPPAGDYGAEIARIASHKREIIEFEQLAFATPNRTAREVKFTNVAKIFTRDGRRKNGVAAHYLTPLLLDARAAKSGKAGATVLLRDGRITICSEGLDLRALDADAAAELYGDCAGVLAKPDEEIDLKGGAILPGITSMGGGLGLTDIVAEQETSDGAVLDPFAEKGFVASNYRAALQDWPLARAVDGLQWGSNDQLRAHAHGVVSSIQPPMGNGFLRGISAQFATAGVQTRLEKGAIRHDEVAMHVALTHYQGPPSISEQIALLKGLLRDGEAHRGDGAWARVVKGELPLVVQAARASHLASLIELKKQFPKLRLVLSNASEVSLPGADLADELAENDIAVLLSPRTWGITWDERRYLPGPPLTKETTLSTLLKAGVKVGLRIEEGYQAANILFDAVFAAKETDGLLDEGDVVSLVSSSLDQIFGLDGGWRGRNKHHDDYVAYDADPFEYGAKVVAVGSKEKVHLFA